MSEAADQLTPGSALAAAARAAAASRKTTPSGPIQALPPPRTAAETTFAFSGLVGASATVAPSGSREARGAAYAVSPSGSVARSTVTPIIKGSDQAETS